MSFRSKLLRLGIKLTPAPIIKTAYWVGHNDGERKAHRLGYNEGYREGREQVYPDAFKDGVERGRTRGYREGLCAGRAENRWNGWDAGWSKGYDSGYEKGRKESRASPATRRRAAFLLRFLSNRLVCKHGESEDADFIQSARHYADAIDPTPSTED